MKSVRPLLRRLLAPLAVASAAALLSLSASSCACCSSDGDDSFPEVTEDNFGAYLMVSFREQYHDIFFALSSDGYTFTDVNNNKPVLLGIAHFAACIVKSYAACNIIFSSFLKSQSSAYQIVINSY